MLTDMIRHDPLGDVGSLRAEINRLMSQAGPESALPYRWSPSSDVIEGDNAIVITAELPGVKDEDIHARVAYGVLKITIPKPVAPAPRVVEVSAGD